VKIALVGPVYPFRGGIAHYTSRLARALAVQGHELVVLSYRRQYPRWLYPGESDRDPSLSAEAWSVPAEFVLDSLWPFSWWRAARRVRAFAPGLVVMQWWTTFMGPLTWVLARAARRAGLRVVFVIHNVLPHEPRPGDRWLARQVLALGDGFLVHSQAELDRLRSLRPDAVAAVAGHPIYTGFGDPPLDQPAARRQLGLPVEARVILFFGIVRSYKGLRVLLRALKRLHDAGQVAHLVVAGEFWEDRRSYEREITALGLDTLVHLTDCYVPNEAVATYFAAADVFAAPYTGGTQSGAAKVALAYGVPIVTTLPEDVAGLPSGPAGAQVVPPGDAEALAEALAATLTMRTSRLSPPAAASHAVPDWDHLARVVAGLGEDKPLSTLGGAAH
jgi:D-inositol-3-phosphate glycosyltransferase